MNPIANIKRTMLRTLKAADGMPIPGPALEQAVCDIIFPKPLPSDIKEARRALVADGLIQGERDELDDELVTYTLTDKGKHQASKL